MRWKSTSATLAVVMIAAVPCARAQDRAGGEFRINSGTAGDQLYPSIARHPGGNFVVVWDDRSSYLVKGQRFDRAGTRLGAEFNVNAGGYALFPAVAMGPKGTFVVVWTHYPDGNGVGIHGRRFDASANPLGAEFQVNTTTANYQIAPNVAVDGQGNFVVAWWSSLQDGSDYAMVGQRFDAQGNRRGSEFVVNTYTPGYQYVSDISSDAAGNFVIVWTSNPGTDGSGSSVNGQRYDANGVPQGAEFVVNSYTTGDQLTVGVAHAPDGSFVVAFRSNQTDAAGDIFGKRYDASGNPIGAEFAVNTSTTGRQSYPDIAMDARGNFVVSWWDLVNDGNNVGVFARRFLADGTARGTDFLVNTYTTGQQSPNPFASTIASDEVGNFVVTWFGPNPATLQDVFAQRYGGLHPNSLVADPAPGNLVWEPGETVGLRPNWVNVNGAAQTFAGTLTNLTGPAGATYTLADGTASYGTVANNANATCTDCYSVTVDNPTTRPVQHWDASAIETLTPDTQGQQKKWSLHIGKSFTDVPNSSPFYRFVETLLHKGVTGGCGGTNYCPSTATTRDQMSVFVLVAKEGAGYTPVACGTPVFADVPASNPFCRFIEELSRRGVVSGCGNGNYCPTSSVTRDAMSVFALRTLDPTLNPPVCVAGLEMFLDVPSTNGFCRWIEELARRGVVSGCGNGNYCPASAVTREQMGVFISSTFGLTLYGT
jgi:S-layer family protein